MHGTPNPTPSQAPSSAVEEYVEKLQFLGEVREAEKRLDAACNEIHDLYGLVDEYDIPVSAMDRAAYATMDSTYNTLKTTMEEVEGARDDHVAKYSANLENGGCGCSFGGGGAGVGGWWGWVWVGGWWVWVWV